MALVGGASMRMVGLNKALTNLNKQIKKIKGRTKQGMIHAGLIIQRDSQKIVPVDLGNLRSSAFVIWDTSNVKNPRFSAGDKVSPGLVPKLRSSYQQAVAEAKSETMRGGFEGDISVVVGYGAFYALFVHEDPNATHKKGKDYKFLERAVMENQTRIVAVIREEASK